MTGQRIILAIAALWGLAGVVMLASGSHPPQVGLLAVGGQFLLFHAAACLALVNTQLVSNWRRALPIALMLTGSGLFALEILLHVSTGLTALAMLAPIGGGLTILGWLLLVIGALIEPRN
ncbi:DUF423 domain-containing protein [Asticcacaulis sp. 201]|uniref:DUF423 domain-containing protein n=1 Tax=Asticcacaulis sp. 201 TaxID=3028787 RepID=UPI0029162A43|nr:DUF423 domain-containing protein [Asticcacaulis sp. 201]MDV6332045.1 DUF423 domain-containing protein [Asticcacaulis sp. 201]